MYDMTDHNSPAPAPELHTETPAVDYAAADRLYRAKLALFGIAGATLLALIYAVLTLLSLKDSGGSLKFYEDAPWLFFDASVVTALVGTIGLFVIGACALVRRTAPELWQNAAIRAGRILLFAALLGQMTLDLRFSALGGQSAFFDVVCPLAVVWVLGGLWRRGLYFNGDIIRRPKGRYAVRVTLRALLLLVGLWLLSVLSIISVFARDVQSWGRFWQGVWEILVEPSGLAMLFALSKNAFAVALAVPLLYLLVSFLEKAGYTRREAQPAEEPRALFGRTDSTVYGISAGLGVSASLYNVYQYAMMAMDVEVALLSTYYQNLLVTTISCAAALSMAVVISRLVSKLKGSSSVTVALWGMIGVWGLQVLWRFVKSLWIMRIAVSDTPAYEIYLNTSKIDYALSLLLLLAYAWVVFVLIRRRYASLALCIPLGLRILVAVGLPIWQNQLGTITEDILKWALAVAVVQSVLSIVIPILEICFFARVSLSAPWENASPVPAPETAEI